MRDHEKLEVCIIDQGNGIEPFKLEQLCEGTNLRHPESGKLKLSLHICCKVIDFLDGSIDFISEVGKGTSFRLIIPVQCPEFHREP